MEIAEGLLFETNPVPLFFFTGEKRLVTEVNKAFADRYFESSEIIGRSLNEVTTPIPVDLLPEKDGSDSDREYYSLYLPGGKSVLVELVVNKYNSGTHSRYLGAIQELFPPLHCDNCIDHPLFQSIFNKARDMILVADDDGQFVQVNDTACRKLGYEKQELLQMGVLDITHGPIRSYGNKKWDDFIRTGVDKGEYILKTREGDLLHTEYRALANIHPGMHLSIVRDVTPQKKLRKRERLKSEAIDNSMNGIAFADSEFRLIYLNKSCHEMWGYETDQELTDRPLFSFFVEPHQLFEVARQLREKGKWSGQLTAKRKDGTEFEAAISITSILAAVESSVVWMASIMDISELQQTKKALKNSKNRFQKLLESAPDAILIVDEDGTIEFCNSKTEELMGYQSQELVGEPVEKLVPEADRLKHTKDREAYSKNPHKRPMGAGLELEAVRKDGTTFPVDIMLGPLEEDDGLSVLAIVRDVTHFKQAQEKLKGEQEFARLLHNLTVIANQADTIKGALQESIKRICRFMEWPIGHVYLPAEDDSGEFYPSEIWYLEQPDRYEAFKRLTMDTRFTPGVGMIGGVIETGIPQWYMNVDEDPRFVRKLPDKDLGVRACFGLPIMVEEEVVGVLEFASPDVQASDTLLLEKMATIGNQLGRVVERRQAQRQLEHSETKFKTLFDTNFDAILLLDKENLIDLNSSALELFKSTKEDLLTWRIKDFFPEKQPDGTDSNENGRKRIQKAFQGEDQFFEWQFKRSDGTLFDAEVSLIHMQLEGQMLVQAIIRDITDRKETERLMQKNMVLFSQLFQNSPAAVVMIDDSEKVINVNSSFERIFGYELSELKGKNIDNFIVPEDEMENAKKINERSLGGDSFQVETTRVDKDGKEIPVLLGTVPVEFENETIATFGIFVDITDRIKAENQLRHSLKEKEVLLKEIHHRVKNNLAVITGLLELQMENTGDKKAYQKLRDSQARIYSMAEVHEQLYQQEVFSSIQMDDYIREFADRIDSTFQIRSADIELKLDIEPVKLSINQAVPCGLLLNELLTNSYKHAFTDQDKGIISISLYKSNQKVELIVADNGKGIPEDLQKGTTDSLGMDLIQTLTKQLQGDLQIKNKEGAHFRLQFLKKNQ